MATLAVHDTREALAPPQEPLSAWQAWGLILIAPYVLVFLGFVLYPVGYGLWLARHPQSYADLFADPVFPRAVVKLPKLKMQDRSLRPALIGHVACGRAPTQATFCQAIHHRKTGPPRRPTMIPMDTGRILHRSHQRL